MDDREAPAIAQTVFGRLREAWGKGDGDAFAAVCTPDADFVNVLGIYVQGTQAIAELHGKLFAGIYSGSTVEFYPQRARKLAEGVVVTQVSTTARIPSGPRKGVVHGMITAVLVDDSSTWRIASLQNTRREG